MKRMLCALAMIASLLGCEVGAQDEGALNLEQEIAKEIAKVEKELEESRRMAIHQVVAASAREGWTLSGFIDVRRRKENAIDLPDKVIITNPFKEPLRVLTADSIPSGHHLFIEFYDSVLDEWRSKSNLVGSFEWDRAEIAPGDKKEFHLDDGYWWFARNKIAMLGLGDQVKMRLALDLGGVVLRSGPFNWKMANKSQQAKPR